MSGQRKPVLTERDVDVLRTLPDMVLQMDAARAFKLLAILQLAMRHPRFSAEQKESYQFARGLTTDLVRCLAQTSNLSDLCRAGFDPAMDV
ncbi:MAG: hypothetical protein KGL39_45475 [Patescibacteria group bacterium]|nr:hypothetical protein [Patescibacteria group bacterium]